MTTRNLLLSFTLAASAALPLAAQDGGPAPSPAGGGSRQMHAERHGSSRQMPGGGPGMGGPGMGRGMMGGGMWWKDPEVTKGIDLTADQTKRIDDIFMKSRIQLIHMHASLEEAELMLEPLMNANPPDTAKAAAAIDKVADTRASLEKANARMLLDIRGVLSAAQWTKLQDLRKAGRGMRGGPMPQGNGGPQGPMPKGQPGGQPNGPRG